MRLLQEEKDVRYGKKPDQFHIGSFTSKEELSKWILDSLKNKQDIFGGYNYTHPVYFVPLYAKDGMYDISAVISSNDDFGKDSTLVQKEYHGKTLTLSISLRKKDDSPDSDDWEYANGYEYFYIPFENRYDVPQYADELADEIVATAKNIVKGF